MRTLPCFWGPALTLVVLASGCGGGNSAPPPLGPDAGANTDAALTSSGTGGQDSTGTGGSPAKTVADAAGSPRACSDLFDQGVLQEFSVDISADEWAKMQDEFLNHLDQVLQGVKFQVEHPIVFHRGNETVNNATIRLKGQSSWVETVQLDGSHPKAQFVIAFDSIDKKASFHGLTKLDIDLPRSDWSFMHERLANNWFRKVGIMAPCSNSVRLNINGQYYGLYVNEENVGNHVIKDFFPSNPNGDLLKGGSEAETNKVAPNWARRDTWRAAGDIPSILAIVDLPNSLLEWAGDALMANGDGFYGGDHNWYIYDEGAAGYVYLPADLDATFDWLTMNSSDPNLSIHDHPLYWWAGRQFYMPPDPHYLVVINDQTWRAKYVDAMATQLAQWDVAQLQSWIDAWSAQIADAVKADPNKWATFGDFQSAISVARQMVEKRPAYLKTFIDCERGAGGADQDGDGFKWCDDCNDNNAAAHPGAPEVCGNQADDNCNGLVDEGCPAPPPAPMSPASPPPTPGH